MDIRLIITDFDGTLVDTFDANYFAYRAAFAQVGLSLSHEVYMKCFGLRFDAFMNEIGDIDDETKEKIREAKSRLYPTYFNRLKLNIYLLEFLRAFRKSGGITAIASTARKKNLYNALNYLRIQDDFDIIVAGESVLNGKPNPEIYEKIIAEAQVTPNMTLIFEDSKVGFEAAEAVGANYIKVTKTYFNYGN